MYFYAHGVHLQIQIFSYSSDCFIIIIITIILGKSNVFIRQKQLLTAFPSAVLKMQCFSHRKEQICI